MSDIMSTLEFTPRPKHILVATFPQQGQGIPTKTIVCANNGYKTFETIDHLANHIYNCLDVKSITYLA